MYLALLHLMNRFWRTARPGAPAPRRPRVEPLEDRWLPSTISGLVYHDANGNGIYDPGESPIAGSTVELHDATGALLDTRVTDTQGRYAFPVDPRIPVHPA